MARLQLPFQLPFQLPPLGRRARLALRYAGIALAALLVFVFALQLTFPYDRLKDKAVEALAGSYEIEIRDVERGWIPGRVYFNDVTLRSRPTKPDEVVTTFFIKRLKVDAGLLSLLGMTASVDLVAQIGAGVIKGNISLPKFGKGGIKIDLEGRELPGTSLPMHGVLGLPMTGKVEFEIELDLPTAKNKAGRTVMDWTRAEGSIDLGCPTGCTIGDGHTKLKPLLKNRSNQVMVGDGIAFGKVNLDTLSVHGAFTPAVGDPESHSSGYKPAKFELTKFDVKSPDGELHVDYSMTLAQEFGDSVVAGCLRFKGSESLLKKEETKQTYSALATTGAELRSDGLFHIRLSDRFKDMKRLNQECGPNAKINNGEDFGGRPGGSPGRPNLTPPPDGDGGQPTIRTGPTPPPPAPQPPPPAPADAATPLPPAPAPGQAPMPEGAAGSAGSATTGETPTAPPKVER